MREFFFGRVDFLSSLSALSTMCWRKSNSPGLHSSGLMGHISSRLAGSAIATYRDGPATRQGKGPATMPRK